MKRLFALTFLAVLCRSAEVPLSTKLNQGNVNLYIDQLTAEPIFTVPGAVPGGDWHEWYVLSVWDTQDLPVVAFRVTVASTTHGVKSSTAQVLTRYSAAEAIPVSGFFHLGADAKISSVLVELLVPAAAEGF